MYILLLVQYPDGLVELPEHLLDAEIDALHDQNIRQFVPDQGGLFPILIIVHFDTTTIKLITYVLASDITENEIVIRGKVHCLAHVSNRIF